MAKPVMAHTWYWLDAITGHSISNHAEPTSSALRKDRGKTECYGTVVLAPSKSALKRLLEQRGLGENYREHYDMPPRGRSAPCQPFRKILLKRNKPITQRRKAMLQVLHQALFVGWLAVRSGRMHIDELVSDKGVLHLIAHQLLGINCTARDWEHLLDRLRHLETLAPECFPPTK